MAKTPKLLTVTQAAKYKHCSRSAIHLAIDDGRLHGKWTTVEQIMKKRVYVVSQDELDGLKIDKIQQRRGKKKA